MYAGESPTAVAHRMVLFVKVGGEAEARLRRSGRYARCNGFHHPSRVIESAEAWWRYRLQHPQRCEPTILVGRHGAFRGRLTKVGHKRGTIADKQGPGRPYHWPVHRIGRHADFDS